MFAAGLLALPALGLAAEGTTAGPVEYRDIPGIGSRNIVWVIAQLHLLLAGFVLGVPIFAWLCEIVGWKSGEKRYDKLAKEFTKLLTSSYATTALFGGILLFLLIGFYPKLMNYLTDIFFPSFVFYCILFLLETATLYLYWYGWDAMEDGGKKTFHIFLGFLLNLFAFFIMIVPNSWATFQASPVVIGEGTDIQRAWAATWNPTWWPVNIHRLIANVVLGGYICGAYAGIRYLAARNAEERDHYDWMGYVGNFIGVFGLLPLPFAGYWLMREIYQYNQQMGITLMGGFMSLLARHYPPDPGFRRPVQKTHHDDVGDFIVVPGCLDDASLAGGELRGSPQDGWHAPSAARRFRRDVRQDDRGQPDDPRDVHELHHVLAGRQAGDGDLGQGCAVGHGSGPGPGGHRGDRPRRVGLLRARYHSYQLLLDFPSADRVVCDVDDHAAHGPVTQERENDHRNGVGPNASACRVCARTQCGHGDLADDADGICPFIVARPLACVRSHA
jgi:hypothetical protein